MLIGAIAAEWTQVEKYLANLLGTAFGGIHEFRNGGNPVSHNWLMRTAIIEAETIRARLKFADATLGIWIEKTSYAEGWETLKKDLQARAKERNKIVHGDWAISDDFPNDLILIQRKGSKLLYRIRDLMEVLERIVACRSQIWVFQDSIREGIKNGTIRSGSFGPYKPSEQK